MKKSTSTMAARARRAVSMIMASVLLCSLAACGSASTKSEQDDFKVTTEENTKMDEILIDHPEPQHKIADEIEIFDDSEILHLVDVLNTMEYGLTVEQAQAKYGEPDYTWEGIDSLYYIWGWGESEANTKNLRYEAEFMDVVGTMELKFQLLASGESKVTQVYWTPYNIENYKQELDVSHVYNNILVSDPTTDVDELVHLYKKQSEVDTVLPDIIGDSGITEKYNYRYDDERIWYSYDDILRIRDHELDYTATIELHSTDETPMSSIEYEVIFYYIDSENIDARLLNDVIHVGRYITSAIGSSLGAENAYVISLDYDGQVIALNDLLGTSNALSQELNDTLDDYKDDIEIYMNGNSIIGDAIRDLNGETIEPYYYVQFNDGMITTIWYGKADDDHMIDPNHGSAIYPAIYPKINY